MILSSIHNLIFPRTCCICGARLVAGHEPVCPACNLQLRRTGHAWQPADNVMARLFWRRAPVRRAAAWIYYRPMSQDSKIIYRLKYGQSPETGWELGEMAAREMADAGFFEGVELIVPVPLTRSRQRQRGYNQSTAIARGVEHATGLPVAPRALVRRSFHESQTHLDAFLRMENVHEAFAMRQPARVRGRNVLLVDDVCTTGATLTACATLLIGAGAASVSAMVLGFAGDEGVPAPAAEDDAGPAEP